MAERPTPQSVAVCTLIALHSDPESVLYKNGSESVPGIEEHISKVISNIVLNNRDGDSNSNSNSTNTNATFARGTTASASASASASAIMDNVETMDLSSILALIAGSAPHFPYIHASRLLLDDLKTSCTSIDSFIDLFGAFRRSTITTGGIDGDSAHGVYVRKRCLGFDQLGFDSVGRFWEACCDYVDAGRININLHVHGDTDNQDLNKDEALQEESSESGSEWPLAPSQISRSLLHKCHELDEQTGGVPFDEMESLLQQILRENPELTMAHYLRFLNCSNQGERIGALEHFHRYFDYAMIQQRKDRLATSSLPEVSSNTIHNNGNANNNNMAGNNPNAANSNDAATQNNRQRGGHGQNVVQYVSIVLASLFHRFGNDELAHMATQEAVRVAQQSGDGACLAYALGWLQATSGAHGIMNSDDSDGVQLLERAAARASLYDIRSLISGASLQRATRHLSDSDRMRPDGGVLGIGTSSGVFEPSHAWGSIAAASIEGIGAQTMNAIGNTIYFSDVTTNLRNQNSRGIMGLFSQQNLVGASLWRSLGRNNLALILDQVAMNCYHDRLRYDHVTMIANGIASSVLHGTGMEMRSFQKENKPTGESSLNSRSLCTALDDLVTGNKSERKDKTHDNSQSRTPLDGTVPNLYQFAINEMHDFRNSNVVNENWYHHVLQLMHESAVRRCDYHVADALTSVLYSFIPIAPHEGIVATIESWGHSCTQFCLKGEWEAAKDMIIHQILPSCKRYRQHHLQCKFLLQLALIYMDSSPGDPVCALPSILECLALSEEESIDPIHATAMVLLAKVHFEMDSTEHARAIMKAVMPVLLHHSHVFFQGEAWLTLAKCTLSEAKKAKNDSTDSEQPFFLLLRRSVKELEHAVKSFEKIKDVRRLRETYYLQAQVFSALPGRQIARNRAAHLFREMNGVSISSVRPIWYDVLKHMHAQ